VSSGPIDRTWNEHDRVGFVRTGLVGSNEGQWANDAEYHAAIAGLVSVALRIADVAAKDPAAADRILQSVRLVDEGDERPPLPAPPAPRLVSDTEPNIGTVGF
jgi:hypothetical protein